MKKFRELTRQVEVVNLLQEHFLAERIAHAYLFVGINAQELDEIAMSFARLLCCINPQTEDACGICLHCLQLEHGNYPDFYMIEPEGKNIRLDSVQEIRVRLGLQRFGSGKRIIIIKDAHLLREEAANCLLTVLEEPPEDTIWLLLTTNLYSILPTIISRCQLIYSNNWQKQDNEQKIGLLEVWQERKNSGEDILLPQELSELLLNKSLYIALTWSERLEKLKDLHKLLELWQLAFRDTLMYSLQGIGIGLFILSEEEVKAMLLLCNEEKFYLNFIELTQKSSRHYYQNINPKLMLDGLFIQAMEWNENK
ncbi:MAG: hypothetical protein WCI30_01510 [Clostridia bacterium]